MRKLFLAALLAASSASAQQPCPAGQPQLMILGSFHMSNPGLDAINLEADDPRSDRRQAEIKETVDRLARFAPTKIAIEAPHWSTAWQTRYAQYRRGEYTLGANEIEQIAMRLAKQLGHETIYPVDFPMWMSGLMPSEQHTPKNPPPPAPPSAPATPSADELKMRAQLAEDQKRMREWTVVDYLAYLNSPERYALNHRWDVLENLRPGATVSLYETTDLATNWYKRNLRIFTNILKITEPGDRVVLLIGAGHLKILNDLAEDFPDLCNVPATRYLKK